MIHRPVVVKSLLDDVASISDRADIRQRLERMGLSAVSVAWEDTARTKNSCLGPNISDMTLQVGNRSMCMIRTPSRLLEKMFNTNESNVVLTRQ